MASFPPPDDHRATPPVLPPKPNSHEASRIATPTQLQQQQQQYPQQQQTPQQYYQQQQQGQGQPLPPQPPGYTAATGSGATANPDGRRFPGPAVAPPQSQIPDPGENWLPQILQDKSTQDLAELLSSAALLNALTNSPNTIHPSLQSSHQALQTALAENIDLANHLLDLESRLAHQRASTQAQLLSTHALEHQWQQRQSAMDHALAPFSPASLYQQLGHGVQEQAAVCQAMEESFLEDDGGGGGSGAYGGGGSAGGAATEKEVSEWVRKYREARVLYYLRQERKQRWDEGRVGGWR